MQRSRRAHMGLAVVLGLVLLVLEAPAADTLVDGMHVKPRQAYLHVRPLHSSSSSSSSSDGGVAGSGRSLQQSATSYQPPKVFISGVKAQVVNTYNWQITRQSSATGISLLASGQERKEMGFTLTYTKVLEKREYVVQGSVDITNLSGQDSLTLMSVTVYVGRTQAQPQCRSMPQANYVMRPAEVLNCPFKVVMTTNPGAASVAGFVQTVRKREEADPVPFTFAGCADESSATPGSTACSTQDVGNCVEVTDGSRIQNRYQDKSGAAAAGPIAQSQLFAVTPVSTSTQGPPRTEPTLPVPAPEPEPAGRSLPDLSSFWGRRRLLHQNTNLRSTQQQRLLLQLPLSTTLKPTGNQFKWPIPQVTGNRPPVGENGKPAGTAQPLRICDTKVFQFAMIFGPLMPAACGIFEVQNMAAAAFVDGSRPPVVETTYFYLTILCPAPATEKDATPTPQAGFRSVDGASSSTTPTPVPTPTGPTQLSFSNFQRAESARTYSAPVLREDAVLPAGSASGSSNTGSTGHVEPVGGSNRATVTAPASATAAAATATSSSGSSKQTQSKQAALAHVVITPSFQSKAQAVMAGPKPAPVFNWTLPFGLFNISWWQKG